MRTRLDEAPVGARDEAGTGTRGLPLLGWAILLLTAVMSVTWSLHKLLWQDEIFSFQTDRVAKLGEVMRIQRMYPISLEAPLYHVLTIALIVTLNVHFYGVLMLIAVCGAELVRTVVRRRLDGPMLGAIAVGMASLVATIPYIKASSEFKKHYYTGAISAHLLTQPYRQMLLD
jgi:hypothetical protein